MQRFVLGILQKLKKVKKIKKVDSNSDDNGVSDGRDDHVEHLVRRHERPHIYDVIKKNPWSLIKGKIPSFSGNGNTDWYYDLELKVRLITLSFEGYALIWWNEISLQCSGMRRASIESWKELKKRCKIHDLFVKLQKMYQGSRSVDEYFKDGSYSDKSLDY
ncbi:hypothetical protein CR513_26106, partial [Mucuna pruriens]